MTMTNCRSWYNGQIYWILKIIKTFGLLLCITKKGAIGIDQVSLVLVMQYTAEMGWIKQLIGRENVFRNQMLRA